MSRAARVPLAIAATATVVAEIGLVALIAATWSGVRDAAVVRHLFPSLTHDALIYLVPAVLLALGIAIAAALLPTRPHVARSVLTQLCGIGTVVVVMLLGAHLYLLRNWEYNVWIGPAEWLGPVSAVVAWAGMLVTAVVLILPATGRALTGTAGDPPAAAPELPMVDTGFAVPVAIAAAPPRALLAALPRFAVAGVVSLAAYAAAVLLTTTAADRGAASIALVVLGAPFAVCTAGACSAAVSARSGRRGAVIVGRLAAGCMLLLQLLLLMQVVSATATPLAPDGPHLALPLGVAFAAAVTAGIVLTLAGRAGLGHPATRRRVRPQALSPLTQPQFSWSAWTPSAAAGPPPDEAFPPTRTAAEQTVPDSDWAAP
jgi:uncharacterized integral membrane protein